MATLSRVPSGHKGGSGGEVAGLVAVGLHLGSWEDSSHVPYLSSLEISGSWAQGCCWKKMRSPCGLRAHRYMQLAHLGFLCEGALCSH